MTAGPRASGPLVRAPAGPSATSRVADVLETFGEATQEPRTFVPAVMAAAHGISRVLGGR